MDKLCKFYENLTKNVDFLAKTTNANFQLETATFPLLMVQFFSKSIGLKLLMRLTNCLNFKKI